MSRRGEIVIECDVPGCHAELVLSAGEFSVDPNSDGTTLDAFALYWIHAAGKDICPQCAEEKPEYPRVKGDDDGVEYGHPGDRRAGRE